MVRSAVTKRVAVLAAAVGCGWMLAGPAPVAGAAAATGIADSDASTFASPLWPGLNVIRVRAIVPYNIATGHPCVAQRRQRFDAWLNAVPPGTSTNVGLQRISDPDCPGYRRAPDEATYRNAFRAFASTYGSRIDRVGPWNEPNFNPPDGSDPLLPDGRHYLYDPDGECGAAEPRVASCGPRMAAYYWRWARVDCPNCNLIAGEFAGTQSSTYIQRYKHHLWTHRPDLWSVHNYADVVRYQLNSINRPAELNNFLDEIYCRGSAPQHHCTGSTNWASGHLWIGATAANYSLACSRHEGLNCPDGQHRVLGEASQCQAAAFINRFDNVDPRITRIYFYTYMDGSNPADSDDTGIVDRTGTNPRRAYAIVRDRAGSCG
jgi:hypothetical protein